MLVNLRIFSYYPLGQEEGTLGYIVSCLELVLEKWMLALPSLPLIQWLFGMSGPSPAHHRANWQRFANSPTLSQSHGSIKRPIAKNPLHHGPF